MITTMSNQPKKEIEDKEKPQPSKKDAATIEMLELLMQRAEVIYKDLGELIGAMDKACIELKAAGNQSWDFLAKDKRPANNGG